MEDTKREKKNKKLNSKRVTLEYKDVYTKVLREKESIHAKLQMQVQPPPPLLNDSSYISLRMGPKEAHAKLLLCILPHNLIKIKIKDINCPLNW